MSFFLPQKNYTDYQLFALQTRMTPEIRRLVKEPSATVHFDIEEDSRLTARIVSKYGSYTHDDIPAAAEISELINREAVSSNPRFNQSLLYRTGSNQLEGVADSWVSVILPIVPMDSNFDIYYQIDDIMHGNYYIDLSQVANYSQVYRINLEELVLQLKKMYQNGVTLLPDILAEPWQLEQVAIAQPGLNYYQPTWVDTRLTTDPVLFLNRQVLVPGEIQVHVNDLYNHAKRFFITEKIRYHGFNVRFDGLKAAVTDVENVQQARQVASYIQTASNRPGKVVYLRFRDEISVRQAVEVMKQVLPLFPERPTWYQDEENQKPYVAVGLIEDQQDSELVKQIIRDGLDQ